MPKMSEGLRAIPPGEYELILVDIKSKEDFLDESGNIKRVSQRLQFQVDDGGDEHGRKFSHFVTWFEGKRLGASDIRLWTALGGGDIEQADADFGDMGGQVIEATIDYRQDKNSDREYLTFRKTEAVDRGDSGGTDESSPVAKTAEDKDIPF